MPDCDGKENKSDDLTSSNSSVASQKSKSIDIPAPTSTSSNHTTVTLPSHAAGDHVQSVNSPSGAPQSPSSPQSPDVHFEPLVHLDLIDVKTLEENEDELFRMRGKLYRFDTSGEDAEWKERGTGDVKILQSKLIRSQIRFIMRQEKTLKIRANHYIDPAMVLEHHGSSDRAFVWFVGTDFADNVTEAETFAVKFKNVEDAERFRDTFLKAQETVNEMRDKMPSIPQPADHTKQETQVEDGKVDATPTTGEDGLSDKLRELTVDNGDDSGTAAAAAGDEKLAPLPPPGDDESKTQSPPPPQQATADVVSK